MRGTTSPLDMGEITARYDTIIRDLYDRSFTVLAPRKDSQDIRALDKMARRYEIPFEVVVALPIRMALASGMWHASPPSTEELLEEACRRHRDLLLARDQHKHGMFDIVHKLIPIRAIRAQLENDRRVMETVALHVGPPLTDLREISDRGLHFVSEYWRVGEAIYFDDSRQHTADIYQRHDKRVLAECEKTVRDFYDNLG